MRWTIRKKLIVSFAAILSILLVVSGFSYYKSMNVQKSAEEIEQAWLPSVIELSEMRRYVQSIDSNLLRLILETQPGEIDKLELSLRTNLTELAKHQESYEKLITEQEEKDNYQIYLDNWKQVITNQDVILRLARANDPTNAFETYKGIRSNITSARDSLQKNIEVNQHGVEKEVSSTVTSVVSMKQLGLTLTIIGLLLGIALVAYISAIISRPLIALAKNVQEVQRGNLAIEPVVVKNRDEIGDLARDFAEMTKDLRNSISVIRSNAEQVAATSQELTASAEQTTLATETITVAIQEIAIGSDHQVDSVTQTRSTTTEIAQGMEQISSSILTVSDTATETSKKARDGNQIAHQTVTKMDQLQSELTDSAQTVFALGEKTKEINGILDMISQIASQTNLLALNAAIEAARAGDAGRGFAVVADEVRKLAEESNKAAEEIRTLITDVQQNADLAVDSMKAGANSMHEGIDMVRKTGGAFGEIVEAIQNVNAQTQEVTAAVEQITASINEMVDTISQVSAITEQNASNTQNVASSAEEQNASMEEVSAASENLTKMAEDLQLAVQRFKI